MENETLYAELTNFLAAVWAGVDADLKIQYRRKIWDIFQSRVEAAARQNGDMRRMASQLARSLKAPIGISEDQMAAAFAVLEWQTQANEALRILREETPYLVLRLRIQLQREKTERKADK